MQNRILSRHLGRTFHSKVPGWKDSILAPWSENNSLVLEQITGTHSSLPMSKRMRSRCQDECEADVNMMRSLCQGKCEADVKPNAKPMSGRPRSPYVEKEFTNGNTQSAKPMSRRMRSRCQYYSAKPMPKRMRRRCHTFPPNLHGTLSHPARTGHIPTQL